MRGVRLASGEIESHVLSIPDVIECAAVEYQNALELTDMRLFAVLRDASRLADESYNLIGLTFGVLALPRLIDVLFCVWIRRNLNTKVGP